MKHWILAALLWATPAFAVSMNTYASQLGRTNLVQLIPGELPLLTTPYAGTPLQSANSGVLIFETNVAPIGTFTLAYTLTMGGSSAFRPPPTRALPRPVVSSPPTLPGRPFFTRPQAP